MTIFVDGEQVLGVVSGEDTALRAGAVPFTAAVPLTEVAEPADADPGTQRLYVDSTTHKLTRKDENSVVTEIEGAGGGGADPFGWNPANYRGTYDAGTTYAYGDAVRAFDDPDWKLYISAVSGSLGNDPVGDDGSFWLDTVAAAKPVVVQGTADPNTAGIQTRITHYTQDADGGTFALGDAPGLAFNANQAAIQAALDDAYWTNKYTVIGDADDFTVEYFDDVLVLDGTNLTLTAGTPTVGQVESQALVTGGFSTGVGSCYLYAVGGGASVYSFDFDDGLNIWTQSRHISVSDWSDPSGAYFLDAITRVGLIGRGSAVADASTHAQNLLDGPGYAYVDLQAFRAGSGQGDAKASSYAEIADTAVGTAYATLMAVHHTGGSAKVGTEAPSTGALVFLGKPDAAGLAITALPALTVASVADDVIANYNALRTALIAAGLAVAG